VLYYITVLTECYTDNGLEEEYHFIFQSHYLEHGRNNPLFFFATVFKTVSRLSLQIRIICKLSFFVYQRIIMKFCILVVGTEYMNNNEKKC